MDSELLYQVVRISFSLALILFLVAVARIMLKELNALESSGVGSKSKVPPMTLLVLDPGEAQLKKGDEIVARKRQTVGRTTKSNISLDDGSVSNQHAILEPGGGRWHVQDLRSTNGTFVNGDQVIGITALQNRDTLQFGRVQLRVMC